VAVAVVVISTSPQIVKSVPNFIHSTVYCTISTYNFYFFK